MSLSGPPISSCHTRGRPASQSHDPFSHSSEQQSWSLAAVPKPEFTDKDTKIPQWDTTMSYLLSRGIQELEKSLEICFA